jgi:hypothetical protein
MNHGSGIKDRDDKSSGILRNSNAFAEINPTDPFVYYESIKRELKIKPIYECRCDERIKTKAEESTRLIYTGLVGELEPQAAAMLRRFFFPLSVKMDPITTSSSEHQSRVSA